MEFQGSQQGVKLDNEKTYQAINEVVWGGRFMIAARQNQWLCKWKLLSQPLKQPT